MQRYWLPFIFLLFPFLHLTYSQGYVPGEVLLVPKPGLDLEEWLARRGESYVRTYGLRLERVLSREAGVCLLSFDDRRIIPEELLDLLRSEPGIEAVQFNHHVTMRATEPNDPFFSSQWQYRNTGSGGGTPDADIDADLAWDISTGGHTALGDTIVVCVIDNGLQADHPDLAENLWVNRLEIPDNGIDDDNNGYVDDYRGWSIITNDDNISPQNLSSHGTEVSGIVGARGDNGVGVAGVNWSVKIMMVKNDFITDEAAVIEAYAYPLAQRKRYNETNGVEGAFVVATNASWGRNFGLPEDAPIWCALYDSLGAAGILNCGATANLNVNVDLEGDLPTACPSDFLVSVTSTNFNDQKVTNAGYGATTIDLGAPGSGVFTTRLGSTYGNNSGTSYATPHVAGAVGLLFSNPCPDFGQLARENPAQSALLVKQMLLDGVDTLSGLQGLTVSGGRLNLATSLEMLVSDCSGCLFPSRVRHTVFEDSIVVLEWNALGPVQRVDLRYREVGTAPWITVADRTELFVLTGLPCTAYEFEFKSFCNGDTTDYSPAYTLQTEGCCDPPGRLRRVSKTESSVVLTWDSLSAADAYVLRFREVGTMVWDSLAADSTTIEVTGLQSCGEYEFQVRSVCERLESRGWSKLLQLFTKGCGACLDLDYCIPVGLNANQEWIARVQLHTLDNNTGSDDSYGDYTGLPELILQTDSLYPIELSPAFQDVTFAEYFMVWMDLNRDGLFSENEVMFQSDQGSSDPQQGFISIPGSVEAGTVRMRVAMLSREVSPSGACIPDEFGFGEMEDYCVTLLNNLPTCPIPGGLHLLPDTEAAIRIQWDSIPGGSYALEIDTIFDGVSSGEKLTFQLDTNFLEIPPELYNCDLLLEAQVRSLCIDQPSFPSAPIRFRTACTTSSTTVQAGSAATLRAIGNPVASDRARVEIFVPEAQNQASLEVYRLDGRLVGQQPGIGLQPGTSILALQLPPGMTGWIIVSLGLDDGNRLVSRILIQ